MSTAKEQHYVWSPGNPYMFTVVVAEQSDGTWGITLVDDSKPQVVSCGEAMTINEFDTEREALEHAAQIIDALHRALLA